MVKTMTKSYKMYIKQLKENPHLDKKLTKERFTQVWSSLCQNFGLSTPAILFHQGTGTSSWLEPGDPPIVSFDSKSLNLLMILHEFCHHAHLADHTRRKGNFAAIASVCDRFPREDWHGNEHIKWFARAANYVMSQGFNVSEEPSHPIPRAGWVTDTVESLLAGRKWEALDKKQKKELEKALRAEHTLSLPDTLTCPKCEQSKPRDSFGSRITERGLTSLPTRVIKQSYCRACRLAFKKEKHET
jgi:hypothetical protein